MAQEHTDPEEPRTAQLEIVREPTRGNPGTAGLGVRSRPDAREGERITVEQLWPNGDAEPVYLSEDDTRDLIHAHMDIMEADS
jgi:hypothetical protein